ncbi:hypothetical protein GQ54DRAFT_126529 [Martensiomyces pterosporus]|nr:hypothetical protein GQ54DRAFT_126529 [Martensiomyces pterosporus]
MAEQKAATPPAGTCASPHRHAPTQRLPRHRDRCRRCHHCQQKQSSSAPLADPPQPPRTTDTLDRHMPSPLMPCSPRSQCRPRHWGPSAQRIRASSLYSPRRMPSSAIRYSTTTCADASLRALKTHTTSRNAASALMSSWIKVLFASGASPRNADHAADEWLLIMPLPLRCLDGDMYWPKKEGSACLPVDALGIATLTGCLAGNAGYCTVKRASTQSLLNLLRVEHASYSHCQSKCTSHSTNPTHSSTVSIPSIPNCVAGSK